MKKEGRPRIDTSKTHDQGKVEGFARALNESLPSPGDTNACDRWEHFKNAALSMFGKKTSKMADWFEAHSEEMTPVIEEKRRAEAAYKACPSNSNLQVLRVTHSKVQQTTRRCANNHWLQLCSQIQTAADMGNIKRIKQALGTTQKKTAPLKSATGVVIQDQAQQMKGWVQHCLVLYSRENVVTKEIQSS